MVVPIELDERPISARCLLIVGLIFAVYLVYHWLLPHPLPGIPFNEHSKKRLLGDVRDIKAAKYRRQWIWSQPRMHGTPVAQMFSQPFRKPVVIVSDYREVVDICSRRLKEFDRGTQNKERVGLVAPNFHMIMESQDERFRPHRELLRDLMTPTFLEEISAPRVYARAKLLVNLWETRRSKADGRPFKVDHDLYLATLDIICSVAFGMEDHKAALQREVDYVESNAPCLAGIAHDTVEFPHAPTDPEVEALLDIPEMIAIAQNSPFPMLSQALALLWPKHARGWWYRRSLIRRQTARSLDKLRENGNLRRESALDQLVWREMNAATRGGRKPDFYSPVIRDETLGFLLGGHDTTATVLSWWVKYMSRHQAIQSRLRDELRQAHAARYRDNEWPTMDDIIKTTIPYLDAVVEESLRYAAVATLIVRRAQCDTQILGYPIPKGTDIMLPLTGPSMKEPGLAIPEALRTATCQKTKDRVSAWGDDIDEYRPERWLKQMQGEDGGWTEVFDPNAGPNLAFSTGPRQCFGKKLAYMQLRTLMTLLTWNFELGELDEALNGDDIVEKLVNLPKQCYVKLRRA